MRLRTTDFGIFVIFAALYAAGTLGTERTIGDIRILFYKVKPGEVASPLVAVFGVPSIMGLAVGQFIANMASELGPIDLYTPGISLAGLALIRYATRIPLIIRCLLYVAITSPWLAFLLWSRHGVPPMDSALSALLGQLIAVAIGYGALLAIRQTKIFETPTQPRA